MKNHITKGLVSIIMPSYNCGSYLTDTISSLLKQSYSNWELLFVDDCSTDNTESIVRSFSDSRIHYYRNAQNCGAAVSRNLALQKARGEWIAFLDSDDLWTPDKLAKQIRFMQQNNYIFSYTQYREMDESGNDLGRIVTGPRCITRTGMINYCWPGCLTVMYHAEEIGLIQIAAIRKNNDYAMWLKIAPKANCYLLAESLARYRKRSGSISRHSYISMIKWHYKLFREAEGCHPVSAVIHTLRNLFFGVLKKVFFVKSSLS